MYMKNSWLVVQHICLKYFQVSASIFEAAKAAREVQEGLASNEERLIALIHYLYQISLLGNLSISRGAPYIHIN